MPRQAVRVCWWTYGCGVACDDCSVTVPWVCALSTSAMCDAITFPCRAELTMTVSRVTPPRPNTP